jgi:2-polyprenyl-3-methyl-5-hydroxy-6-metoxy-1,4-benzoquinol methylase
MKHVYEQSEEQQRWDQYGQDRIDRIKKDPDSFIVNDFQVSGLEAVSADLMDVLHPLTGQKVLELGCGWGNFAVFLAKQGAEVTAVDIGPSLIAASRMLAEVNHVSCDFRQANIVDLPFEADSYDKVVGLMILHHLSRHDLESALHESFRVLKPGGVAVFYEPVENSKAFDFVQNLVPVGSKSGHYHRPSILNRKAWLEYVRALDDRSLTNRELTSAGQHFGTVKIRPYGLLVRISRLIGRKYKRTLAAADRVLLRSIPPLRYLCQTVLVEYRK